MLDGNDTGGIADDDDADSDVVEDAAADEPTVDGDDGLSAHEGDLPAGNTSDDAPDAVDSNEDQDTYAIAAE